jgi:indole-3-glycerol phosphate synthase
MKGTFLNTVVAETRERVARAKSDNNFTAFRRKAEAARQHREEHRFREALAVPDRINIIAEFKRASPSRGVINDRVDPAAQARGYVAGGAAALSVLTEPEYFQGSMADLLKMRGAVETPILRKDFIVDEYQIVGAAAAGADAVLLIVAALPDAELSNLRRIAEDDLGMDALVEVHEITELERATDAGATLIGVNNRDLRTLEVSLDVSRQLIEHKPTNFLMIAESGLSTRDEIDELRGRGFDGFLIGGSLMEATDPERALRSLIGEVN